MYDSKVILMAIDIGGASENGITIMNEKEQIAEKTQLMELDYDEVERLNNYDCTNKVLQKVIHRGTL